MGRVILVLIIVAGLIWGLSSAECPKCDGSGEFSRQEEHKNDCFVCKGRGELKCSWQTSWIDKGFAWNLGNYEHKVSEYCKGGKIQEIYNGYVQPLSNRLCPRCSGSAKENCHNCSGYGYIRTTKNERFDDSFCSGSGEVSNFKVLFN